MNNCGKVSVLREQYFLLCGKFNFFKQRAVLRKNSSLGIAWCWTALKAIECLCSGFPLPVSKRLPYQGLCKAWKAGATRESGRLLP